MSWLARVMIVVAVAAGMTAVGVASVARWGDEAARAPGSSSPEAGFARDMAVHHAQAVEMSFLVRDASDDPDVGVLAFDIINTQATQRGMLLGWLDQWDLPPNSDAPPMAWAGGEHGNTDPGEHAMPGMATDSEIQRLRESRGREAEDEFLRLMIAHHEGGVEMAEAVLERTRREEVRRLATTIVRGQQSEIAAMKALLTRKELVDQ